jgi:transcriptional regulator with GAF, ATPase, and Fis domain
MIMNKTLRIWRGIAAGGLSLALVGGIGLPVSALAAGNTCSDQNCKMMEHTQAIQSLRGKMLVQAKAEDAALEKLVAELNKAPQAKKVDLEAAILTKLVAMHHQRLGEWETLHARLMELQKERMQTANAGMSGSAATKGMIGQSTTTAKK